MARRAEPFLAAQISLFAPFIPFSLLIFGHRAEFCVAAQALDAVIAIPACGRHLLERWVETVYVHSDIAHFADDYHVLLIGELAHVANFAVLALPREHRTSGLGFVDQGSIELRSVARVVIALLAGTALQDVGRLGWVCLKPTLLAVLQRSRINFHRGRIGLNLLLLCLLLLRLGLLCGFGRPLLLMVQLALLMLALVINLAGLGTFS